jgi:hypothetical protein
MQPHFANPWGHPKHDLQRALAERLLDDRRGLDAYGSKREPFVPSTKYGRKASK